MLATVPADMAQYFWHVLVIPQKLAYLYGWPQLLEEEELDEETEMRMTLFIGVMMGNTVATRTLAEVASRFGRQIAVRLPRYALTKTAYYPIVKQVGKWIGISVTKQGFAKSLGKAIPVVGGVISGSVTYFTMKPMANQLRDHLKTLEYAKT